jgi:S1-C subfamily serine protease
MTAAILPFAHSPHHAMMALHSVVPDTAMTAEMLGTERESHAVQISADGLMLTVGYSIMEADEVWLTNYKGQTAEGIVLSQDYDSGIALLRPSTSLGQVFLESAPVNSFNIGDKTSILSSQDSKAIPVELFAKEEYAGRWEYLLEEAYYTTPLCEHWSGAALINADQQLCGIGSLAIGIKSPQGETVPGNLFIPVELVMPHLEYMSLHGQKPGQLRPWLGTLVEEYNSELHVIGIYHGAPAARAGIQPGDVILSVDQEPVSDMAGFFRTIWRYGPAGSNIPLTLRSGGETRELALETIDRNTFFVQHASNLFN